MEFRVWDKKKKRWVDDKVFMTPDGELVKSDHTVLGWTKTTTAPHDRYVYHKSIDLYDKNDKLIFVGDYIKAEVTDNKIVTGLVTYAEELSAYVILCLDVDEYYTLGQYVSQDIEIVGNVFDGLKEGD